MRKLLLLAIPTLLILVGCSPESQYVGKWRGKVEMGSTLKSMPMGAEASQFTSMFQPTLDLRPDKTFTLSMSMAPIDGTWKLDDDTVILTPEKVMGMDADEAKRRARKELDHAASESPMPLPIPNMIPGTSDMKMSINQRDHLLTLDPGSGTFLAGFGKIVFKKL